MRGCRSRGMAVIVVGVLLGTFSASWAGAQPPKTLKQFGEPVYPAYEGWYENADGSFTLLVGYFNPNKEQTLDVEVGEGNYISPGPQDRGQPTHFPSGRGHGLFTIQVPADFGDQQLTWTLTTNNQTVSVPFHLQADYYVEPFLDASNQNQPPTIRFAVDGETLQGPPVGVALSLTATVGTPLELSVWTSDVKPTTNVRTNSNPRFKRPALVLKWHKLRGPGDVEFAEAEQKFEESSDQNPTTTATFTVPGVYLLRVEALDETGAGGGGFQCCWTSAQVTVTVS